MAHGSVRVRGRLSTRVDSGYVLILAYPPISYNLFDDNSLGASTRRLHLSTLANISLSVNRYSMSNPTQNLSPDVSTQQLPWQGKVKSKVKKLFQKRATSRDTSSSPSQARGSGNPTRSEKFKEGAGVLWSGIETSLNLLKECSDWNPILKSVVGGIVACIDLVGVCIFPFRRDRFH